MAYGLKVWNTSNVVTFDTSLRTNTIITSGNSSVTTSTSGGTNGYIGYSPYITVPDLTSTNTDQVDIAIAGKHTFTFVGMDKIYVVRGTGTNEGKFRVYQDSGTNNKTFSFQWIAFRV